MSGLIQGFTEFLPVSSSGHLCLFQNIFAFDGGGESAFTFDVMLHLATLAAVFIVYRSDIYLLMRSVFSLVSKVMGGRIGRDGLDGGERYALSVICATLPMAAAVVIGDFTEALYSDVRFVGCALMLNALVLFVSDRIAYRRRSSSHELKPLASFGVGCFQLCAVIPGLSRSGMTVTGGLTMGLDRESAVRFSFIMSIPVILCANLFEIPDLIATPIPSCDILPIVCGMAAAFVSGICSMKLLAFVARRASFRGFAVYCAAVGAAAVLMG